MTTLFDLTLALSEILQYTVGGTADSGGGTTTLPDAERTEGEDEFTNGTIWFTSGANDGISKMITNWEYSTQTFSFEAVTEIEGGETYKAAEETFPRWLLIMAINQALRKHGEHEDTDESLTVVADQSAYSLPAGVRRIARVEIQTSTSEPYWYQQHLNWKEVDDQLVFETGTEPADAGKTIRLTYNAAHAEVTDDSDTIDAYIHTEFIIWAAAVNAWRWKMQQYEGDMPTWIRDGINEALANEASLANRFKVKPARRDIPISPW